jgi:hypothetical protein
MLLYVAASSFPNTALIFALQIQTVIAVDLVHRMRKSHANP